MPKVIVITGAGVGLGRALARQFVSDGHAVALLGRTAAKVEAVAEELGAQAMALACDVSSPDSVNSAFAAIAERHGQVDVLINNAAIFEPFQLVDATDQQIQTAVSTNLMGPMFCIRAAVPLMRPGSHIIGVTSESVDSRLPHLSVYQATKAGVERLNKTMSEELAPLGIRVTTARAGSMYEEGKAWEVDPEAARAFHVEALARGINLLEKPLSQFTSVVSIFSTLIQLPPDFHVEHLNLKARKAD